MAASGIFLAFDIGLKRTGVASGQASTHTASPCSTIAVTRGRLDWSALDQLIAQWQPDAVVIGDPKSNDPHLNKVINRFKSHIQQQHKLPIFDVDERLSSNAANQSLADRGLSLTRKTELRDQIAACLILETFFNLRPDQL
jgi:putative Holliday junction resolvase